MCPWVATCCLSPFSLRSMLGWQRKRRAESTAAVDAFTVGAIAALHCEGSSQREIAGSGSVDKPDGSPASFGMVGKIPRRLWPACLTFIGSDGSRRGRHMASISHALAVLGQGAPFTPSRCRPCCPEATRPAEPAQMMVLPQRNARLLLPASCASLQFSKRKST